MAVEYPDVMNDITDARKRFESGAVQFLAEFAPQAAPAGSLAQMPLTMQNVMDVPVKVAIRLELPAVKGKLKRLPQPLFQILQAEISLTLESAEVVQLTIPIYIQPHVPADAYPFSVAIRSAPAEQGTRVRSKQSENHLGDLKIRLPQGLGITQIASWGFEAKETQQQVVSLTVSDAVETPETVDNEALKPALNSVWTVQDWDLIPPARREMNERRIHIMSQLTAETLYLPFIKQTQAFFASSGVQLHVGEAIFLSKILTYMVVYMASKPEWLDCLLVPIYAFAQASGESTGDIVWLLTELGYIQVLEFAIAASFTMAEDALRRQLWKPSEQRAVRDFIVSCLDEGQDLPNEFVYLPLLLGGMLVADQVVMEGEDMQQSFRILASAKADKADLFADPDLRELDQAFNHILAQKAGQ
ncbi:MAG: hypothetical protein JXA89_19650 [Anaerolineae bacterium]|nr:hypothetical protein [Anaerolineae bacterium]